MIVPAGDSGETIAEIESEFLPAVPGLVAAPADPANVVPPVEVPAQAAPDVGAPELPARSGSRSEPPFGDASGPAPGPRQRIIPKVPDIMPEPVLAGSASAERQDALAAEVEPDLGREDTQGLSRDELAEAIAAPVLDDGGLWDPVPVTLPTYVTKARARRTVRTIEITGMTSSGHDAADTALARTAEEAARAEAAARAQAEAEEEAERKAAGA